MAQFQAHRANTKSSITIQLAQRSEEPLRSKTTALAVCIAKKSSNHWNMRFCGIAPFMTHLRLVQCVDILASAVLLREIRRR